MGISIDLFVSYDQIQKFFDRGLIINRYVPRAKDPGKGNIVMNIEQNTEEDEFYEYPYYIARIQRRFISTIFYFFQLFGISFAMLINLY